jgi:hypothetical protein
MPGGALPKSLRRVAGFFFCLYRPAPVAPDRPAATSTAAGFFFPIVCEAARMKPLERTIGAWLDELTETRCLLAIIAILAAALLVSVLRRDPPAPSRPPADPAPRAFMDADRTLHFDPPVVLPPGGQMSIELDVASGAMRATDSDGNAIPIEPLEIKVIE